MSSPHAPRPARIYRGYHLVNHGYYPPDRCVWWEAQNIATGEADFRAHTMRDLKQEIDDAAAKIPAVSVTPPTNNPDRS